MKGISKKLILIVLACTLGVVSLLGMLEYHAEQLLIDRQLERSLETIGARLSLSLRQSLYELDRVTIHDTILSEFPSKELQAIIVWGRDRQQVVVGFNRLPDGSVEEREEVLTQSNLSHRRWPVVVPSDRSPEGLLTVGEIDVFVHREHLESALTQQIKLNLIKVLLAVGLILIVLSKTINSYLVAPLEHIQQAMRDTKKFYLQGTYEDNDIERLTELFSANWTENAFRELQQMDQDFRSMIVAAHDRQEALAENENKYRRLSQEFETVMDGLVDSLMLFDRGMQLVWGNKSALKQFGLSQEALVGSSCHQLWEHEEGDASEICIEEIFTTGNATENICTDKQGRIWGVKAYPVADQSGKVVNVIQIASDLSEKFRLREEASRAAHLAALGELSAGIAHEINNPTGLILMVVPFVKDAVQDLLPLMDDYVETHPDLMVAGLPYETFRGEILRTIEDISGGAMRVKRIVNDLKDFAREESAREDNDVDLQDMTEKSLRLLHNVIKNSTDHFILDVAEDLPKIKGSMQRLEQVLVNLVQNACQALTSRDQFVKLRVYPEESGKTVIMELSDQGQGIPKEIMEKITDPFFTTRREVGGTGLGLSVSTRIIDEHGGVMKIASKPGKGSTFTIKLPISKGDLS